jgi:hypothetical protein
LFDILFYLLLVFGRYYLGIANYGNLQDIEVQNFEKQQVGEQGKYP